MKSCGTNRALDEPLHSSNISNISNIAYCDSCTRSMFESRRELGQVNRVGCSCSDGTRVTFCRCSSCDSDSPNKKPLELPFGFEGVLVRGVRWADQRFNAVILLQRQEVLRRQAIGVGAVVDFELLDALSHLPLNEPVAWSEVDPMVAAVLDCAPSGLVARTTRFVQSLLAAPIHLVGLFTVADHWRALQKVGMLAATAPTGVVVRHKPRELQTAKHHATRYGLGLAVLSDTACRGLVSPADPRGQSIGYRRLQEVIYGRWLDQTRIPANSHQAAN